MGRKQKELGFCHQQYKPADLRQAATAIKPITTNQCLWRGGDNPSKNETVYGKQIFPAEEQKLEQVKIAHVFTNEQCNLMNAQ